MRPLLPSLRAGAKPQSVGPRIEGLLNKLVAPRHRAHARVLDLSGICRKA